MAYRVLSRQCLIVRLNTHHTQPTQTMLKNARALLVATLFSPMAALAADAVSTGEKKVEASNDEAILLEKFVTVDYSQTEVSGKGFGEGRATVSVPAVDIAAMPAGQNPIILLAKTPGINVQTSDNIGLYEHANRIQIRAFNINQIAVTLDGVPMGQQNYYGGTPVDRLIDSESIDRVDVSTGVGSVTMFANTALGGAIRYYTKAPQEGKSVKMAVSYGDNEFRRGFFRVDTGEIAKNLTSFVSYSGLTAVKWRGLGNIYRDHFATQLRYLLGDAEFKLKVDYNRRADHDYRSMSLAIFNTLGRYYEYPMVLTGPTGRTTNIKQPDGTTKAVPVPSTDDAAYWDNQFNYRRDTVISFESTFKLSPDMTLSVVPYYDRKWIFGGGNLDGTSGAALASYNLSIATTPSSPYRLVDGVLLPIYAPKGVLYSERIARQERFGLPSTLVWKVGSQQITAAGWFQDDKYHRADIRWNRLGGVAGGRNLNIAYNPDIEFVFGNHDVYHHFYTAQFALEDQIKLMQEKLTVTAGIKSLHITDTFHGFKNAADFSTNTISAFSASYSDNFLPSLNATFALSKTSELFASFAESMSQPPKEVYYVATYPAKRVKAESATVGELGWRYTRKKFNLTLAAYDVQYHHRLLSFNDYDPTSQAVVPTYADVGGITSRGLESAFAFFPMQGLRFSTSLSYNDTKFDDNYFKANATGTGTVVVLTKDKVVPDFPKVMANAEVNYNWKSLYSGIDYRYLSKRYSTSTNLEWLGGYGVYNMFFGYQAPGSGRFGHLRVQFNISNLFDKKYLSSISPGELTGSFQPGAPRTTYVAVSTEF